MRRNRRRRDRKEIRAIIERFRKSGLTQQAFARQIGTHVNVLGRWIRRERAEGKEESTPPSVVPVQVIGPLIDGGMSRGIEIVLESQRVVRVQPGFDDTTLERVIGVLERC